MVNQVNGSQEAKDVSFSIAALQVCSINYYQLISQEIPDQFIAIRKLHLL